MKHLTTLVCITYLLLIAVDATGKQHNTRGIANIIDVRSTEALDTEIAHHKYHDVTVCRIMGTHPAQYIVFFYLNANGKLFCHKEFLGAADDMNKVAYKWITDNAADIRLYSTHSKKETHLRVFGRGTFAGMEDPIIHTTE